MKRFKAKQLRALIERGTVNYTMTEAAVGAILMPKLKYDGGLINYKDRIGWPVDGNYVTMMARTAMYDTVENDPAHAPNLWALIREKNGFRYIEENMAAELAFDLDEKGWWEDKLYKSKMQGNPYTPASAPTVWEEVIV